MVDEKTEYTTFTTEEIVTETKTYESKVEQTSMSLAEEEVSVNQKSGHIETEYDVNGNQKNVTISAVEKKLIRKLDFIYVMPFVAILNFLQVR